MKEEKILEGVEETLQKALELETNYKVGFCRTIFTKNKKYLLTTILKPLDKLKNEQTRTKESI